MTSSPVTLPVPTAAERIRAVCRRAPALLAVADADPVSAPVCHLLEDGSAALVVPVGAAVAAGLNAAAPAMLELTDHAPVPLRERVRALVWIRGRLQPVPAGDVGELLDRIAAHNPHPVLLQVHSGRSKQPAARRGRSATPHIVLRLAIESVVIADPTGAESVPLDQLLAARPDPLCGIEADWLRHLSSAHPDVVARLATRLPARFRRGPVHAVAVDRYGMWLRVEDADGDHDARLAFPQPVNDVAGLNRAVRALVGCPFRNGLRPRTA